MTRAPTALLWLGTPDADASNPACWSTGTVPRAGDGIISYGGSMIVHDNALHGDPVSITMGPSGMPGSMAFDVFGKDAFSICLPAFSKLSATVYIEPSSTWVGSFYGQWVGITGPGKFSNSGTSTFFGGGTVSVDVIGRGAFLSVPGAYMQGTLEFLHGVSAGQSITVLGEQNGEAMSSLKVDDPKHFHGAVTLKGSIAELDNMSGAASASVHSGILSVFNAAGVVLADFAVTGADAQGNPQSIGVSKDAAGTVYVVPSGVGYDPAYGLAFEPERGLTMLPVHA